MRILFISHDAGFTGAPVSLLTELKHFKINYTWDMRILVTRIGPSEYTNLMHEFEKIAPTQCYFEYSDYDTPEEIEQAGQGPNFQEAVKRQKQHERQLRLDLISWSPDIIYSNTALNGALLRRLGIDAPVFAHVRELEATLKDLDSVGIEAFKNQPFFYFAVSSAVRDNLVRNYDIPLSRIKIAPDAIEFDEILEKSKELSALTVRQELGLTPDDILIGNVGSVIERKGYKQYFDVAREVIEQTKDKYSVSFVWLGEGPELEKIRERIQKAQLQHRIRFIGFRKNPYPYIRSFDIALMSSLDDPFPRVNLEAGALGIPTIAFADSGGSKEFIGNDCGFVVPGFNTSKMVESAIKLIENSELRKTFGRNAKAKALNHYDISVVAPSVAKVINSSLLRAFFHSLKLIKSIGLHSFVLRILSRVWTGLSPHVQSKLHSYSLGKFYRLFVNLE